MLPSIFDFFFAKKEVYKFDPWARKFTDINFEKNAIPARVTPGQVEHKEMVLDCSHVLYRLVNRSVRLKFQKAGLNIIPEIPIIITNEIGISCVLEVVRIVPQGFAERVLYPRKIYISWDEICASSRRGVVAGCLHEVGHMLQPVSMTKREQEFYADDHVSDCLGPETGAVFVEKLYIHYSFAESFSKACGYPSAAERIARQREKINLQPV